MSNRNKFIGVWVSKEEKDDINELAKGMNTSVSDVIRHRVIRPMMTLPEAIQSIKLYFDMKFNKLELKMTELIKTQRFETEPIRRRMIIEEEYIPVKPLPPPKSVIISATEKLLPKLAMKKVLAEMTHLVKTGELTLETTPLIEIERPRAKTDPMSFIEFKARKKK